jgi:hypothetical protein
VRPKTGYDSYLPGEGLLLWKFDTEREQVAPTEPALTLVQADGQMDLETNRNNGDAGDPFPGASKKTRILDSGRVSTSFPLQSRSGVTISNIQYTNNAATFLVTIAKPLVLVSGASTIERAVEGETLFKDSGRLPPQTLDRILCVRCCREEHLCPIKTCKCSCEKNLHVKVSKKEQERGKGKGKKKEKDKRKKDAGKKAKRKKDKR